MHLNTPLVMIPTLEHSTSASSMLCVVSKIDLFPLSSPSISQSYLLFSGSNPVDGSSKNIMSGYPTKLIATDSLRFIPPLNSLVLKCLNSVKYTSAIA